ncbi:uncharacterized protein [Diadema antillarum]|uniref:uncharacterized protein n=1 Tax=Diadema antillarum TaxID=105358 RepID=UPI003A8B4813
MDVQIPRDHQSRSGSADFCDLYETRRPPSTCRGYRPPFFAWFFGDPHINTLDGRGYTFNGLGEYVMLEYTNGNPFVLQARTGKAFNGSQMEIDTGTVFIGFAATQGITTVRFILNYNRTELFIQVNDTNLDINTLRKEGFVSTDAFFSLSYINGSVGDEIQISAVFSSRTYEETGFTVTFKFEVLSVTTSVSEDVEPGAGRGLLGVVNGDPEDDFQFRNGTTLLPAPRSNLTEAEIFEFGQSWLIDPSESLFDYGSGSWSDYNDPDFRPPFLDELLTAADPATRAAALEACGDDRECLFDYLAVGRSFGLNTMATAEVNEINQQRLENFPPEIISIIEIGDTNALMENNTLYVIVGETYTLKFTATDPNNDTVAFSLDETVPQNSSIDNNGLFVWTPMNTDLVSIDVVVSDGSVQTSESLLVKICLCKNNGTCNFQSEVDGGNLLQDRSTVVMCDCTEGYDGDHCEMDEDSCAGDPCYLGIICFDDPPPATQPRCGDCPPHLAGDGFVCYDVNECAEMLDDCEQECHNTQGSYTCSCLSGYTLSLDMRSCLDIDECSRDTHTCADNSVCINTDGSFNCTCEPGFMPVVGEGNRCDDEDECRNPTLNRCDEQATCQNGLGYFSCFCNDGWTGDGLTCSNINECENGTNNCSPFADCVDSPGSYKCLCLDGYRGTGVVCFDVDECDESSDNCTFGSRCVNTDGSFECPCLDGFNRTVNGLCEDIDECSMDPCSQNAGCTNFNGSFGCKCRQFYQGNGFACEDIDECLLQLDDCVQGCVNSETGYTCTCGEGFELDSDNKSCSDINECETMDMCETACFNTEGSFVCNCSEGFMLESNERNCTDIDECMDHNICSKNAECSNTVGGFNCSCPAGYSGSGYIANPCLNIDECVLSSPCGLNARCNDTEGSFTCSCFDGYTGNGFTCTDVDECFGGLCDVNADCVNSVGSYMCTCRDGYNGNGDICSDINECDDVTVCADTATCTNTNGSYVCSCQEGYRGDPYSRCDDIEECRDDPNICPSEATCSNMIGSYLCICSEGYELVGENCTDFDECVASTDSCQAGISVCHNTQGDYACNCSTGYQNSSPKICEDANECMTGAHNCSKDRICINTVGSFKCECADMSFEASDGSCQDVDECLVYADIICTNGECENTIDGYNCTCNDGYEGNGDSCLDIDECDGAHGCDHVCQNTNGSYVCTCNQGFELAADSRSCTSSRKHRLVALENFADDTKK